MENIATTPETINFIIPIMEYFRPEAEKKIEAMRKACHKYNVPEPEVTFSETYTKTRCIDEVWNEYVEYKVFDLSVNVAATFKLEGGYKLQAVVDNATGDAVAVDIDTLEVPLDSLTPSTDCDHCGISRERNKSFVLLNPEGNIMRVGSSCVKKFLGINPQSFISMLNYYNQFKETIFSENEESFKQHIDRSSNGVIIKREEAISALVNVITSDNGVIVRAEYTEVYVGGRYNGYTRRERTNAGKSTCERAIEMVIESRRNGKPLDINHEYEKSFIDFVMGLEINITFDELDGRYMFESSFDTFKNDMFKFVERDMMIIGDIYPLCGAISYFEKWKLKKAEEALRGKSEYVGTVGEKHKFKATLQDHKSGEGVYGTWHMWTLVDENNNTLTKFGTLSEKHRTSEGTEPLYYGFKKGDMFAFTAEVKEHKEFAGVQSTSLGRMSKY